jgi:hypothetical protein
MAKAKANTAVMAYMKLAPGPENALRRVSSTGMNSMVTSSLLHRLLQRARFEAIGAVNAWLFSLVLVLGGLSTNGPQNHG